MSDEDSNDTLFEFSTESEDGGYTLSALEFKSHNLEPPPGVGNDVSGIPGECAIVRARSTPAERDSLNVPIWIKAEIHPHHATFGSAVHRGLPENRRLNDIIRRRGLLNSTNQPLEDAGHLLALCLSGIYADYNMLPQNVNLNRGWQGNFHYWRALEYLIFLYLKCPMPGRVWVKLQIRLWNEDSDYPDRGTRMALSVWLMYRGRDNGGRGDADTIIQTTRNLLNASVQISTRVDTRAFYDVAKDIVRACSQGNLQSALVLCRTLEQFLHPIRGAPIPMPFRGPIPNGNPFHPFSNLEELLLSPLFSSQLQASPRILPQPVTARSNRSVSAWDFVPVVGSVRSIVHGLEDLEDGDGTSAAINLTLGVGSLVADACMVGGLVSSIGKAVTNTAVKTAAKETAKTAAEETAKAAAKETAKAAAKETAKAAAKETAKAAAETTGKEALKSLARSELMCGAAMAGTSAALLGSRFGSMRC